MESATMEPLIVTLNPCNVGCRFAEPLRDHCDWIWCTHPRATVRIKSTSYECASFAARPAPGSAGVLRTGASAVS